MMEWLVFLRTVCAFAEGAAHVKDQPGAAAAAAACVFIVLGDPQRRLTVLGGREGMPRSLASVYGGSVTRFLRGGFRGEVSRAIVTPRVKSGWNGVAVSRDGSALLVSDYHGGTHALHMYCVHTGACLRTIGRSGSGPLQFQYPSQLWVASDGFVFVADFGNDRIQILTPDYQYHSCVGIDSPLGVCVNDKVVVVSHWRPDGLTVFRRDNGKVIRRFGMFGRGDGQLSYARGLCFMSGGRNVAVADCGNHRVSVWTLEGKFVRHVGERTLAHVAGVACSDADELIVADWAKLRVLMFSASGQILWSSETCYRSAAGTFTGVTVYGSSIFGQTKDDRCVVFT